MKQIPIFKVGRHTDMGGTTLEITEADLEKTVAAYQPSRHEAPLVAGHPQHDAPAWGWVASLALVDGVLMATLSQVEPNFSEQVAAGRYKKISASFYTPQASSNPYPGVYYLRHVGFLGAQPPAVKGLPDAAFREGEEGVVILETVVDRSVCKTGSEQKNVPVSSVEFLERKEKITRHNKEKPMPDIPEKQEVPHSEVLLQRKEEALNAREVQFSEREERLRTEELAFQRKQRTAASLQFVEALIQKGQVLPRHCEGLVAFMSSLDEDKVLEFSETGDTHEQVTVKAPMTSYFSKFLSDLPVRVDYSERSADTREKSELPVFSAPEGYEVDLVGLEMHQKILSYARVNNMDFVSAALALNG